MLSIVKRNIPIFISVLLHILAVIFFYIAAMNYNPESPNLIEFSFEGSGGSPGRGLPAVTPEEKEDKLNTEKKSEEDIIPTKEKSKEQKIVNQVLVNHAVGTAGSPNGIGKGGNGSGGTGTGGTGTGGSLGIPIPAVPKPVDETYYVAVDEMPEPFGGIQAIESKINYTAALKQKGIEGTVFVLAFVDENGTVRKTLLTKGIGNGCDEAAMNAVFRTRFKAGRQNGRPVKVQIQIPVPINR